MPGDDGMNGSGQAGAGDWEKVRRDPAIILLAGWTLLSAVVIFWLAHAESGPSVYFIDQADGSEPVSHRGIRGFFKNEFGLSHLCPWLLLGPYFGFLALRFPFERERLKTNLPINAAGCLAFLAGAYWIGSLEVFTRGTVMIIRQSILDRNTNGPASRPISRTFTERQAAPTAELFDMRIMKIGPDAHEFSSTNFTNWTAELRRDARLPLPPGAGASKLAFWPRLVDLLAYGVIVGGAHSIYFYRRFREREQSAIALEANLARAQLNALQAQLQPHFLFNSLNAIVALVRRDPRAAEATLVSLSELLRMALKHSERQEIPLREELEFVQRYVEIQRTRFGDRLSFKQQVDDSALNTLTPTLLLQPLVENAIRHGIEPSDRPGGVAVVVRRAGDRLVFVVEDNGVGLPMNHENSELLRASRSGGNGIGLKNLRSRLERLYGNNHELEVSTNATGGVTVRVEIPWRIPGDPAAAEN